MNSRHWTRAVSNGTFRSCFVPVCKGNLWTHNCKGSPYEYACSYNIIGHQHTAHTDVEGWQLSLWLQEAVPKHPHFIEKKTHFLINYGCCQSHWLSSHHAVLYLFTYLFIYALFRLFLACWAKNDEKGFTGQWLNLTARVIHNTAVPHNILRTSFQIPSNWFVNILLYDT